MDNAWKYMPDAKDVSRIEKLIAAGDDGKSQACRIKDRYKAIRRYRASLDLGTPLQTFADKARDLGADNLDFVLAGLRNSEECLDAADWAGDEILNEAQADKYMRLMLSGADGWSVLQAAVIVMLQDQRDQFAEDLVKCVLPVVRKE